MARMLARLGTQPSRRRGSPFVTDRPLRPRGAARAAAPRALSGLGLWPSPFGAAARGRRSPRVPRSRRLFGDIGRGSGRPARGPAPGADLALVWYDPTAGSQAGSAVSPTRSVDLPRAGRRNCLAGRGDLRGSALPEVPGDPPPGGPDEARGGAGSWASWCRTSSPTGGLAFIENVRIALGCRAPGGGQEVSPGARPRPRGRPRDRARDSSRGASCRRRPDAARAGQALPGRPEGHRRRALRLGLRGAPRGRVAAGSRTSHRGGAPLSLPQGR